MLKSNRYKTLYTFTSFKEILRSVQRYVRYVEYHPSIFRIKGRRKSCVITTLSSNKNTQSVVQKGSQNNCEPGVARRIK